MVSVPCSSLRVSPLAGYVPQVSWFWCRRESWGYVSSSVLDNCNRNEDGGVFDSLKLDVMTPGEFFLTLCRYRGQGLSVVQITSSM